MVPPGDIFNPNTGVMPEELNYLFNQFAAPYNLLLSPLTHWSGGKTSATVVNGASSLDVLAWDDFFGFWMAVGHTGTEMTWSQDDGDNWIALTTGLPSAQFNAIGPHPGGLGWSLVPGGTTNIQWVDTGGTVTDTGTHLGVAFGTDGIAFPHAASGKIFGIIYDNTNHNIRAYTTPDGTTITDVTSSVIPTTWSNVGSLLSPLGLTYALGPNNDALIAFGGTPGTSISKLLYLTWNGSIFLGIDLTAGLPARITGKQITGVAYNFSQGLWGVMGWDGSLFSTMYTSPDFASWTNPGSPSLFFYAGGLASIGPYWFTTNAELIATVTRQRAIASLDGFNWRGLGSSFGPSGVMTNNMKLAQGPGNLGLWNVNGGQVSHRVGL